MVKSVYMNHKHVALLWVSKETYIILRVHLASSLDFGQAFYVSSPWHYQKCQAMVQIQNLILLVISA